MLYLQEGWLCLESAEGTHELFNVTDGARRPLDRAAYDAALKLLRGREGEQGQALAALIGTDQVEERTAPFDRVVQQRLAELDESFDWMLPAEARPLLAQCQKAHSLLRHWRQDLDQLPVLPETALRRALVLQRIAPRPDATVALVGDDDLVAVPAAALGLRPTVFDLDDDLLATHSQLAQQLGLSIETVSLDLKQPLPPAYRGFFDLFATDPETSRECICLFFSRALALCRAGGRGIIACAEEWQPLFDEAREAMAVERTALYRRFNNYREGTLALASYRSDLHSVSSGPQARPLIAPQERFEGDLFPFGLAAGDHLVATARHCHEEALRGPQLPALLQEILGKDQVRIEDRRPFPVRVVTAESPEGRAQATVHADGHTVNLDISPWNEDKEATPIGRKLTDRLGAQDMTMRCLRRLE
jgi:hypothetical protein